MVEEQKTELNLIEQANLAALRLEQANMVLLEANKTKELLLQKEEQLQNNRLLGGKSSAGESYQPQVSEQEKITSDTKNFFKGGIIESYIDKVKK